MKEILFRGKTIHGEKWIIGNVLKLDNLTAIIEGIPNLGKGANGRYYFDDYLTTIDPKTLGQFINDYDRDNIKIFEGDIVDILRNNGEKIGRGVVIERDMVVENGNGYLRRSTGCGNCRVVGNIHDDLDLIDDKTKIWLNNYYFRNDEEE